MEAMISLRVILLLRLRAYRPRLLPQRVRRNGSPMDARLDEYRKHCVTAEQKAQEDFDKWVLTLSGGGLGTSFAFIKDLIGTGPLAHPLLLFSAWSAWAVSIVATLASFFFSQLALRTAIRQV